MLQNKIEIQIGDTTQTLCSGLEQELLDDQNLTADYESSASLFIRDTVASISL